MYLVLVQHVGSFWMAHVHALRLFQSTAYGTLAKHSTCSQHIHEHKHQWSLVCRSYTAIGAECGDTVTARALFEDVCYTGLHQPLQVCRNHDTNMHRTI
jgi:hypothetical protein